MRASKVQRRVQVPLGGVTVALPPLPVLNDLQVRSACVCEQGLRAVLDCPVLLSGPS